MFTVIFKGTSYTHRSRDVAMARLSAILVNHPDAIVVEDEPTLYSPAHPGVPIVVERVFRVEFSADQRGTSDERKETDSLLHRLWTKAVGTPGYEKSEWKELERRVWELMP